MNSHLPFVAERSPSESGFGLVQFIAPRTVQEYAK